LNPQKFKTANSDSSSIKLSQILSTRLKFGSPPKNNDGQPERKEYNDDFKNSLNDTIRSIKYFNIRGLKDREQFNSLIRALRIKLKILTERVLVTQIFNDNDNFKNEDIVTNALLGETKTLSEYESNLLFCLAEDFEVLKHFKHPRIQDLKEEFIWIQNNFDLYLFSLLDNQSTPAVPLSTENNKNDVVMFFEGSNFCTDPPSPIHVDSLKQSSLTEETKEKLQFIKNLYWIDGNLVESMLSLFYLKYSQSTANRYHLLIELCNSPQFEMKLMDFCFFFLYCPEHLLDPSTLNQKIHNLEFSQSKQFIYQTVAENILEFFKIYLSNKEYLIYQPKVYLNNYGLKSLRELKKAHQYCKTTQKMGSICDLLIGLLDVKEISSSKSLKKALSDIISLSVLSFSQMKFETTTTVDHPVEKPRILTVKSLELLIAHCPETIKLFKQIPDIVTFKFNSVLEVTCNKANLLYIEKGFVLKIRALICQQNETKATSTFKALIDNREHLSALADLLEIISLHLVEKNSHENIGAIMEQLLKGIVQDTHFKKLIFCLFELLLAFHQEIQTNYGLKSVAAALLKTCIHFYNLHCLIELSCNKENYQGLEEISELSKLLEEVCKKYRENIVSIVLENNLKSSYEKLLLIVCKKIPGLLDFTVKRQILNEQIRKLSLTSLYGGSREIIIERHNLLKTTLAEFLYMPAKTLRQKIKVKFANENGIDGGGLTREYLTIIIKELFDPRSGLFCFSENNVNIQPSSLSAIIPHHLVYFELAGLLLAKTIQHEYVADINLTQSFLKHILEKEISMDDLGDVDPQLLKSLEWVMKNQVDGLEQSFVYESRLLEQKTVKELILDGHKIILNEKNKENFVQRTCQIKLKEEISDQLAAFLRGFHLIIPANFLTIFTPSELQLLISGPSCIDIEQLKQTAEYRNGYTKDSLQIIWLWEVLNKFSQKELGLFALFVSGSPKLPFQFEKQNYFKYAKPGYPNFNLPVAHTCSFEIVLPEYRSQEELERKLKLAIYEGQGSFMLS